jgi:hypothetical protein
VALTAAGTLTAAQLNRPPFQTLEPGVQRIEEPIPLDYVTAAGKDVQCQAFLEFRNLTDDQVEAARTYVADRNWSGFGQRSYDTARRTATPTTVDSVDRELGEVIYQELLDTARDAVPGAGVGNPDATGPNYNGHSMYCPTGQR